MTLKVGAPVVVDTDHEHFSLAVIAAVFLVASTLQAVDVQVAASLPTFLEKSDPVVIITYASPQIERVCLQAISMNSVNLSSAVPN